MVEKTKPAIKSLSIWGNVTGLLAVIAFIRELYASNPGLVDDTQAWFIAAAALVSQLIGIIGRWRAVAKISGWF